jgi:hypothetical protein
MKPRIDISNQNNLTIWESGRWNEKQNVGRAILVAGPEGEKLNVVYECDPTGATNYHYLFFANAEQIVASAYIKKLDDNRYKYDLELSSIVSLTTNAIQGESVASAKLKSLWTLKQIGKDTNFSPLIDKSYTPDRLGFRKAYRDLLMSTVQKALTPSEKQKLFWGIPRQQRVTT